MHARSIPSPPAAGDRYDVELVRNCAIPTADGIELAADVYLPRGATASPVVVSLVPYHKDGIAGITGWRATHHFAARGYACVVADSRGTGSSGGRPRPPFDPADGEDGCAVVEWAARQPWSDGNVGMWGVSYAASTTLRTAALRPPALKAIAAVMAFVDPERDFVHPGGRRGCLASLGLWGLTTLAQHLVPPLLQDAGGTWQRRWRERLDDGDPFIVDLLRHGPGDPAWRPRAIDTSRILVPTFCVAGWRDLACDATVRVFETVRGPRKLLVGPWMHTLPDESPFDPAGFLPLAAGWWERWLRGRGDGGEDSVTVFVQHRRAWKQLPAWPPSGAGARMSASADGRLVETAPPLAGVVARRVDPTVGVRGGLWGVPTRGFGLPRDQHEDDVRALAFTSAACAEPLVLCGRPVATIALDRRAGPARTLVARLAHVAGNGCSTLITSGTVSLPALTEDGTAAARIELIPTAYEIPAGDRLRLVVAGADFPRLWPDTGSDELSVRCEADRSCIDLPVAPLDRLEPAVLPPPDPPDEPSSLVLRADPLYTVTHDAMHDGVTVTVGDHLLLKTPQEERALDINTHVSATVSGDRPEAAQVRGRSTTRAHTPHGEFVARAELLVTGETAVVTGEVSLDGQPVFARRWTA